MATSLMLKLGGYLPWKIQSSHLKSRKRQFICFSFIFIYFSRLQVGAQRNRLQEFQYETKAERQRAYDDGMTETALNQACHNSLRNSHADLRNRYADLQARHAGLQNSHAALQTSYADLQTGYADLQVRVKRLEDKIFSGP